MYICIYILLYVFYITILMEVFFYKVYIIFGNYSRLRLLPLKKKMEICDFNREKMIQKS